jgi:hypothetical protein
MELRIETAALLLALAAPLAAAELRFEVRHDHWRKSGAGVLVISERGISFTEPKQPKHGRQWEYTEIQQLEVAPAHLRLLSYEDVRWRLGADREHEFVIAHGDFLSAYQLLKDRLDQRLVAALNDVDVKPDWEVPARLTERFGGVNGVLKFAPDRVVFSTARPDRSRTWRWRDIDNLSSSGPFELTLITFERARTHFGNRKGFNFQLKQPLPEQRYNALWQRLNRVKNQGASQ